MIINKLDIILSKKTKDFKPDENNVMKSSPDELSFITSTFINDGLNSVPALIYSISADNRKVKDCSISPIKNDTNKPSNDRTAIISEKIAENLKIALLLKVVLFALIKFSQAP